MPHSAQMYRETFIDGRNWVRDENVSANFPPTRLLYERWIFTILEDFIQVWREWKDCEGLYTFGKIEILDKED